MGNDSFDHFLTLPWELIFFRGECWGTILRFPISNPLCNDDIHCKHITDNQVVGNGRKIVIKQHFIFLCQQPK